MPFNIINLFTRFKRISVDPTLGDPVAQALTAALLAQNWNIVLSLLEAATDPDELAFLLQTGADVQGIEQWLGDVVRHDSGSRHAVLLYACRLIAWGWEARTGARAKHVTCEQFVLFQERLALACQYLRSSVRTAPDDATAWWMFVLLARGLGWKREEALNSFDKCVASHAGHIYAHDQMLQHLCQKWGGSHDEMHRFANESTFVAPPGSPLGALVAVSHIERWIADETYHVVMRSDLVRGALNRAADRSVRHAHYQQRRNSALEYNKFAMAFTLAADYKSAVDMFDIVDRRVNDWPWCYLGNASHIFVQLRKEAYERR